MNKDQYTQLAVNALFSLVNYGADIEWVENIILQHSETNFELLQSICDDITSYCDALFLGHENGGYSEVMKCVSILNVFSVGMKNKVFRRKFTKEQKRAVVLARDHCEETYRQMTERKV